MPNPDITEEGNVCPISPLVSQTMCRLPPLSRPVVISVEGNIGAGKSTFLKVLLKHFGEENVEVMQEPVSRWTDVRGQNMLEVICHPCPNILKICFLQVFYYNRPFMLIPSDMPTLSRLLLSSPA